jgi:hypothetical protein
MVQGNLTLMLILSMQFSLWAQRDYDITFQSGPADKSSFVMPSSIEPEMMLDVSFNGRSYLLLQFFDIPDARGKQMLESMDVHLLHYVPNYAYYASVPENLTLSSISDLRAVLLPKAGWKLSQTLFSHNYPGHALEAGGNIRLEVIPFADVSLADLAKEFSESGYAAVKTLEDRILLVSPLDRVREIASHPGVLFVAEEEAPSFPEGSVGNALMRGDRLRLNGQIPLDGSGVSTAIADDGTVSHLDFKGRLQEYTTLNTGTHGDMTAGILAGAGNIDPLGIGTAPGSTLHLYYISGYPHIANAVDNLANLGTVITSTSYGDGCGGIYSTSARDLDAQVAINRQLLHVFSAGNNGQQSCGQYGGLGSYFGARYGNITGGRKASKHSLAVANLFFNDSLRITSSRGPLNDGVLKPDLAAPGQGNYTTGPDNTYQQGGGTSAASPAVAGLSALLYQAFRIQNNGANPSFGHIKTVLFNTAEDLGRPGPDYDFGWGRPNGEKALKAIQNNWFVQGTVSHQGQNIHTINVPPDTRKFSVMIYWFDPPATAGVGKTLVNDLDLSVITPSNQVIRPWVLSTSANLDSLVKPAYRFFDRVNVVEQVTIDDPQSGPFRVQVNGHIVPQGPQDYIISYFFEEVPIKMTYPNGGESFVPGETEVIRWDAMGSSGNFQLQYSNDSMQTWINVSSNIPGRQRFFNWVVPQQVNGKTFFRISRGGFSDHSDHPCSIIGLPNFQISNVSSTQARISWGAVPGANTYTVYQIGAQYMEPIGVTSSLEFPFDIQPYEIKWLSVQAGNTSGIAGRRATAKSYQHLPCQANISLTIRFDQYPGETSWELRAANGLVVARGGPYSGQAPNSTITENLCLPFGCYALTMLDAFADGICCASGQGFYQIRNAAGLILVNGGQFGGSEIRNFCIETTSSPITVTATVIQHASCFGRADGIANATATQGLGNYQFTWSNGATGPQIGNLMAGNYTVTVSDGINQAVSTVTILQPQPVVATMNTSPVLCPGAANGSANVSVSGGVPPYSFAWSTGSTSSFVNGLPSGIYGVTVSDSRSCTGIASSTVQQPSAMVLGATPIPATTGANGSIMLTVEGGTPPFQFAWSNGSTLQSPANLSPGTYQVTVTDANQCTASRAVTVTGTSVGYCASKGNSTAFEWIQQVQLDGFLNVSGNNGGYANFTNLQINATAGSTVVVNLQPGYNGNPYVEYWRIWIDFDKNGTFNNQNELVLSVSASGTAQGQFTIPAGTAAGTTRMRISMRYNNFPQPCSNFSHGEVEDYTLSISPQLADDNGGSVNLTNSNIWPVSYAAQNAEFTDQDLTIYPNPASDFFVLEWPGAEDTDHIEIEVNSAQGQLVKTLKINSDSGLNRTTLNVSQWTPGAYWVKIRRGSMEWIRKLIVLYRN